MRQLSSLTVDASIVKINYLCVNCQV